MSFETQINDFQTHLNKLSNGDISELDETLVSNFISRITIDRSVFLVNFDAIKSILNSAVKLLYNTEITINFTLIIELLDAILEHLKFDDVIDIFPLNYIIDALNSSNENLQILSLKVSSKASPPDLISNTEILPRAISLLSIEGTPISVVNECEKMLSVLLPGELVRRRVLSESVLSTLTTMSNCQSTTVKTRLLDFIVMLLPFISQDELPKALYTFNDFVNDDILYTLNLVKFYSDLLDIIDSSLDKEWLLKDITPQLEQIAELYQNREENIDIQYFAIPTIIQFFKKISYVSTHLYYNLDQKYIKISKNDIMILSTSNPDYIVANHPDILKVLKLNSDSVPIFMNLIKSEKAFNIIQDSLNSHQVLRLAYNDLIVLLLRLSEYDYSTSLLLHSPQIMKKLLNGINISEPDSYESRKLTLENLNNLSDEELDVWKLAVRNEYSYIVNGKPVNPEVSVLNNSL